MGFDSRPLQIDRPISYQNNAVRNISLHAVQGFPKPSSSTKVTAAFGALATEKFTRLLNAEDVGVIKQDLTSFAGHMLGHPSRVAEATTSGSVSALNELTKHSDREVRTLAARCLELIAVDAVGKDVLAQQGSVEALIAAVLDSEGKSADREGALQALQLLCEAVAACERCVSSSSVESLVELAKDTGHPHILKVIFHCCGLESGLEECLGCNGLTVISGLMLGNDWRTLEWACKCSMRLSIPLTAKKRALGAGIVSNLCALLTHGRSAVRRAAGEALSIVAVDIDAKQQALEDGCAGPLAAMLSNEPHVQLVAAKAIIVVAEAGREPFTQALPRLDAIAGDEKASALLRDSARRAAELVRWRP